MGSPTCAPVSDRLSLGMARRVGLARAFIIQPTVLLMDEPFVSSTSRPRTGCAGCCSRRSGASPTVLFVTHNLREAITPADRIVLLLPTPARLLRESRCRRAGAALPSRRDQEYRAAVADELPGLALAG